MEDISILRARLRKRDKDIRQAIMCLSFEEGELADMIRDGLRKVLIERGLMDEATKRNRGSQGPT